MSDDLLPCPFCGGEAYIDGTSWTTRDGKEQSWVTCRKCGTYGPSSADAIAAWNRRAIPATDAREAFLSELEDHKYLILKRGFYYRPDRKGYTNFPAEAGRYTLAQAVFLTHPNGPDGPRDGLSFVPLHAVIGEAAHE